MNIHSQAPSMTSTRKKGEKMFALYFLPTDGNRVFISKHRSANMAHEKGLKVYKNESRFLVLPMSNKFNPAS